MNIKRKVAAHHVKKEIVGKKKYFNHLATHETMTCNLCKTVIKKGSRGSHKCNENKVIKCDQCQYETTRIDVHEKTHNKLPKEAKQHE